MPEQQRWYNRQFFPDPTQRGGAGGGFMGGLDRFFRGAANDTVANTAREIVTGGMVNPARGIAGGLRDAVRGSNWYHNRQDRQGELGPPSRLAGPQDGTSTRSPVGSNNNAMRNEGFLGRLDNSFESGTNPLAAALGLFTGYGQYGTGEAATNAYNANSLRMANTPINTGAGNLGAGSRGDGGNSGGGTGNNSAANYGTGGNAVSSRWIPQQTGTRLVRRT